MSDQLQMKPGIDPEILKLFNPTPWQRFLQKVNRILNHILYRLRIKKY